MEILLVLLIISGLTSIVALLTNPFSTASIIALPFRLTLKNGKPDVVRSNSFFVRQNIFFWVFAVVKSGTHIMHTRYVHSIRAKADSVHGVIRSIHKLRYNPNKLLLISGDHFSGLFVRNLGVFLYPVMDRNFAENITEWRNRQIAYVQTVAYALMTFSQHDKLTTTIMPTGRLSATCVNFYAYPSDTLYGILYALAATAGVESAQPYKYGKPQWDLEVASVSKKLLNEHKLSLSNHYAQYRRAVFDTDTGLVNKSVHLSGAKDITKRSCAFYDNVIFWKTSELAMNLGIIPSDDAFLTQLKTRILDTFWLDQEGYFLEDISEPGIQNKYYSSDWLIALATGFLNPYNPNERIYYERSVSHIISNNIDEPFPIKYHQDRRASRQFWPVRIAVASYGGDAIWSFWGMEYIKVLLALGSPLQTDTKNNYIVRADRHIASYASSIVTYGGFPEVYDNNGRLLKTRLYQSICQTSWVIGYEQVLAIRKSITGR